MNWEIAIGIFTLVSFVITVSSVFVKYIKEQTKSIVEVSENLKFQNEKIETQSSILLEIKNDNKEIKEKIYNHETRITLLENKGND